MFIYIGHGDTMRICGPYWFSYMDVDDFKTSMQDFQPFGFGFSCLLGNIYKNNNFARAWLTSTEGGVTFLGSTTTSYADSDRYFSRTLFKQLKNKPDITIGEFVGNGKAKYYNALRGTRRRQQAKKYVLYGDPSLYLFGIDLQYNNPFSNPLLPQPQRARTHDTDLGDIVSIRIYSVTGQLLRTCYTNQPEFQGLPAGTYMVVVKSKDNQTTQKIVLL